MAIEIFNNFTGTGPSQGAPHDTLKSVKGIQASDSAPIEEDIGMSLWGERALRVYCSVKATNGGNLLEGLTFLFRAYEMFQPADPAFAMAWVRASDKDLLLTFSTAANGDATAASGDILITYPYGKICYVPEAEILTTAAEFECTMSYRTFCAPMGV